MSRILRYLSLPIVSLLLSTTGPVALADEGKPDAVIERATFELRSGETLVDVPFEVDQRFRTVRVETSDGERHIGFLDIVAIRAGNLDLTPVILGRSAETTRPPMTVVPAPPDSTGSAADTDEASVPADDPEFAVPEPDAEPVEETWHSDADIVFRGRETPPWHLGLRVAGNTTFPVGDYYDGIDQHFGYEADLLIGIKRDIAMRLSVSRAGLTPDDGYLVPVIDDPGFRVDDVDWSMRAWRFSVAAQSHRRLGTRPDDRSLGYVYVGVGAIWQELTCDFAVVDEGDGSRSPLSISHDETKFLTTVGGGLMWMFSRNLGLDVAAELDVVWIGTVDDPRYRHDLGNTRTATLIDFKLGIVTLFD